VALLCSNNLRKSDVFARYGGEEFFILLSGTPVGVAYGKAESLRAKISNFAFQEEGIKVTVTASFGVAAYDPADSFDDLIKKRMLTYTRQKKADETGSAEWFFRKTAPVSPTRFYCTVWIMGAPFRRGRWCCICRSRNGERI
jgi:Response regulator containing a CheY-like receiver domain and a GGDEF domain